MKRPFALALIASLLAAPLVMAQPATAPAPTKPTPTKPAAPVALQPKKETPAVEKPKGDDKSTKKDDKKEEKPAAPAPDMKKAMDDAAKAGPNHKLLEWFEGVWQVEVKDLTPGQESTDKGEMTAKMVYGSRFLQSEFDGRFHGKFFRGGGMMGYNNTSKKFESTWADARDTAITFMSGTMSADNKVLTLTSEMTDPTSGKKVTMKEVDRITGKDTYTGEFYMGEMKIMELSYVRGKAEKKDDKKDEAKEEKPKGK